MGLHWLCCCAFVLPGAEGEMQAHVAVCARCRLSGLHSAAWESRAAVCGPGAGNKPSSMPFACTRVGMLSLLQLPSES